MALAVPQLRRVADVPGVLGVLRRLASRVWVGAQLWDAPCWMGIMRSPTWANGWKSGACSRCGNQGERVPPSLMTGEGLAWMRCVRPISTGG